ncbi:MAG: hypothetical protein ACOVLE_05585, partial [Pirellula staleyi]
MTAQTAQTALAGAKLNPNLDEWGKTESRKIPMENAASCGTLRLSSSAEDKGFEPSTGFPAPDF